MSEHVKLFLIAFAVGFMVVPAWMMGKALVSNRALRKRLGLAMKPEYMETRQLRRQYARGFARGATKLAKEMNQQKTLPRRERFRLWCKHNLPTFVSLYRRVTVSRNAKTENGK